MKLTDKRFWIFEVTMLLCGVVTTCVEALNYGISPFYLIGHLVAFPLCFCISGIAVWKIAKGDGVWQLIGYSLLFSTIVYCLFHIILYPIYGVPFNATTYLSGVCYYILFSIFPIILCCYAYKSIINRYFSKKHTNSSGIMKQTDDISKVLSTFKTLAATQVAATENGDYRKGNKAFKQIIKIIKYLKGLGRVSELETLLSDSNVGVRMFAAFGLLQTSPDIAVPILTEIAQREDIHSLTARTTLEEWESNTLIYPF